MEGGVHDGGAEAQEDGPEVEARRRVRLCMGERSASASSLLHTQPSAKRSIIIQTCGFTFEVWGVGSMAKPGSGFVGPSCLRESGQLLNFLYFPHSLLQSDQSLTGPRFDV